MCMSSEYVLGLSNLKRLIDVYLEPLIEELQNLWHVGVLMWDSVKNEIFTMHAALMWTANDLPAYGMAFGWSIAGVIGCPVCIEDTRAFFLQNGRKSCYLTTTKSSSSRIIRIVGTRKHSLRTKLRGRLHMIKKSIFWELEYWSTHLIRHNLDVMHIAKNVFDNIFNTVMDIEKKTRDNLTARKDLKIICN
ncbi:UNVERIFIED_CONTAM: hypothetical protein Sangu_2639900 [Sesamum angustifolium]|uniref:Uncharacterized protein n=1 Tax=Sesamum angustifolium TaxID=2727405 RepID=A0AAW2J2V6_9LAMI